jgi:hypothetical protein
MNQRTKKSTKTSKPAKITKFGRPTCRKVSDEALEALNAVAEKFGLIVKNEPGRFTHNTFTAKFTFSVEASDGTGAPADFAQKARLVGLPEDCFGKEFTDFRNQTFTITGVNLRAKKYPVQVTKKSDGRGFKMPAAQVAAHLARS